MSLFIAVLQRAEGGTWSVVEQHMGRQWCNSKGLITNGKLKISFKMLDRI